MLSNRILQVLTYQNRPTSVFKYFVLENISIFQSWNS